MREKLIDNGFNVIDNLMTEEQLLQSDAIYRKELRQMKLRKIARTIAFGLIGGVLGFIVAIVQHSVF